MPNNNKPRAWPENWPASLPYLSTPVLASQLRRDILSTTALTSPSLEANVMTIAAPDTPYTNIRITPIADPAHPACGQSGLVATRAHLPGSFICLYMGFVHDTNATAKTSSAGGPAADNAGNGSGAESADVPKSDYDLSLDRDLGLAIDADKMGNEARFINDYRGVADRPNAEFRDVIVKLKGGKRERHVGVFVKAAKKEKKNRGRREDEGGIAKGCEILVSYGRGFWSARRLEAEAEAEAQVDVVRGMGAPSC